MLISLYSELLFYTLICITFTLNFAYNGQLKEYCFSESFNPVCEENEVIVMKTAYYGQMRLGRCVDENYGYLGCSADILDLMDKKCSGRQTCDVLITSIKAELNCSIPKTLVRYMEAQYICTQVVSENKDGCEVQAKSRKQNLASMSSHGCGGDSNPWIIQAKPGQKVNVSFTDFNWNPIHTKLKGCLQKYGSIIEVHEKTVVDLCGKTDRERHVMLSHGNVLQIVYEKMVSSDLNFIITFQAVGCPTFESAPDTWTKKDNDVVTVGCIHSDETWKMRCIGNHWIGIVWKCEKANHNTKIESREKNDDKVLGISPVIVFSSIGGIFLIIVCVVVTVALGYFCIRKSKPTDKGYYLSPLTYNPTMSVQGYPSYRTTDTSGNTELCTLRQHTTQLRHQQGLLADSGNNANMQVNSPQYFVLEKEQKEPIYDAVYQNITENNCV